MSNEFSSGPPATATVGGHPIHPMLIPFPIAFLVATLVCDAIFAATGGDFWARGSYWLLVGALASAALAAAAGFADFLGSGRIRAIDAAWHHMIGNLIAVLLSGLNFLFRIGDHANAVLPIGITISASVVGLLLYTGWMGGHLVYNHRVGVHNPAADPGAQASPATAPPGPIGS